MPQCALTILTSLPSLTTATSGWSTWRPDRWDAGVYKVPDPPPPWREKFIKSLGGRISSCQEGMEYHGCLEVVKKNHYLLTDLLSFLNWIWCEIEPWMLVIDVIGKKNQAQFWLIDWTRSGYPTIFVIIDFNFKFQVKSPKHNSSP